MNKFTISNFRFPILTALVAVTLKAHASLTAVVTPAYQFPLDGSVAPSYALLNELATPTVQILGSIGGSNTLSPGSVTGVSMSDSFVDGVTISYNTASPRQIQVKSASIATNHLNTNDWKWPLVQGNNSQFVQFIFDPIFFGTNGVGLTFFYDTNFFTTNGLGLSRTGPANTVTFIQTNGAPTNTFLGPEFKVFLDTNTIAGIGYTGMTVHLSEFISAEVALTNATGMFISMNHGFTNLPTRVRWVVVCKTAELGYNPGDEFDSMALAVSGDPTRHPVPGTDRTNVFWAVSVQANALQLPNKTNPAAPQNLTAVANIVSNFKLKCYASP
jgi:hypothetical protein